MFDPSASAAASEWRAGGAGSSGSGSAAAFPSASDAGPATAVQGRAAEHTRVFDARATAAAVAGLLAAAQHLAQVVAGEGAGGAAARRAVLVGLGPVEGVLAGVRSRVLLAERDAATWQRPGVASFEAAHGSATRGGLPGARREIRQAEVIATMPTLADAVQSGTMPVGHLDAFARIATDATDAVSTALGTPAVQDAVVRMAATQDTPTFTRSLARMVAELDPATRDRTHHNQRARRFLHLSDQPDGTHLRGLLDHVTGHRLRLALEATGERPGTLTTTSDGSSTGTVLEERTSEQARADALDVISRKILSLPETATGASVPPQISLLMTEQTFAALRTHASQTDDRSPQDTRAAERDARAARRDDPHPSDTQASALTGVPPVTLEDGTPVPFTEVAKILCDCAITRIVMNAADQPVNLGRTARLYTGAHRRAIIARDRHCTFPGCDRHARWAEIHHITWWDRDNGDTSLDNGVLLCSYHHHQVHQHNLTIHRHPRSTPQDRNGPEPPGTRYTFHDPTGRNITTTEHHPPGPITHRRQ